MLTWLCALPEQAQVALTWGPVANAVDYTVQLYQQATAPVAGDTSVVHISAVAVLSVDQVLQLCTSMSTWQPDAQMLSHCARAALHRLCSDVEKAHGQA